MKVIISGSSGFIGKALVKHLLKSGHEVIPLKRDEKGEYLYPEKELEGEYAVIHLGGENVGKRWTKEVKEKILKSRVNSTKELIAYFSKLKNPPSVWFQASAIGVYGSRGNEVLTEESASGDGFLASVVKATEREALVLEGTKTRLVLGRIGIVLSKEGGALKKMLLPFKLGVGGILGNGSQYMSFIPLEDLLFAISFTLENKSIKGPCNLVTKDPVTNFEFTKALGKVLHRWTIFPVPDFVIKAVFGEMGEELLLSSQRVIPEELLKSGFKFKYPEVEEALKSALNP